MERSESLDPPDDQTGPESSAGTAARETADPNFTNATRDRSDAHGDAGEPRMATTGTFPPERQEASTQSNRKKSNVTVSEVMTADVAVCNPTTQLTYVARMMEERDCGAVPVVESTDSMQPIGIVTDRDIVIRALARNQDALSLCAGDVMSVDPLVVHPDLSMEECAKQMEQRRVRRAIVVDHTGRCCGILAQADIAMWSGSETAELVRQISEPDPQGSQQHYH
jgi:CBS domain-containing protein